MNSVRLIRPTYSRSYDTDNRHPLLRPLFIVWNLVQLIVIVAALAALVGCVTTADPVAAAKTTEQKAYALWGEYNIAKVEAASLMQDEDVSDETKLAIQKAHEFTEPLAEKYRGITRMFIVARRAYEMDREAGKEGYAMAEAELKRWIDDFDDALADLQASKQDALESLPDETVQ